MNILAICARPEDLECYCAGTLLKYYRQGHKIFIATTTSGSTESNQTLLKTELAAIREAEQRKAALFVDAQVRFLSSEDAELADTPAARRAVLTAIRWADPDIIFTDTSADHAMTTSLVTRVILSVGGRHHNADLPPIHKKPQVFFFTAGGNAERHPRAYVDVTDVMNIKKQMLLCHESRWESEKEDFCGAMEDHCRRMGIQAGYAYAEGFTALDFTGYRGDYRMLP